MTSPFKPSPLLLLLVPVLAIALLWSTASRAAGLQVSPIMLEFSPGETAQSLWLANTSDRVLQAQVRVLHWTQVEGRDQLEASRALVASPPMVEIAPGQRQMVRVVRLDTSTQAVEQAFRLLIDELPSAPDEEAAQGLSFLLQYSVPVFVAPLGSDPQAPPAPQLSATLRDGTGDGVALSVHNSGNQRARLSNLVLEEASGERSMLDAGLLGYVLAGQQMAWPLSLPAEPLHTTGQLKARINDDTEEHTLLAVAAP